MYENFFLPYRYDEGTFYDFFNLFAIHLKFYVLNTVARVRLPKGKQPICCKCMRCNLDKPSMMQESGNECQPTTLLL